MLETKLLKLNALLAEHSPLAIAFSGGVDSTFLLGCAKKTLGDVVAVTAVAPNFAPDEIEYAKHFCRENGIHHILVDLGDEILSSFCHNPPDRCYICKKAIFSRVLDALPASTVLADGTNADDAADYRPGAKALAELSVLSPLRDSDLTKEEVRQGLAMLYQSGDLTPISYTLEDGTKIWDKPAFACLASRIPYGETITKEKLAAIYTVEKALHDCGFSQVRVRCHGEIGSGAVARIEVLPSDREKFFDTRLMDSIGKTAAESGFAFAALDLSGYQMGNLNINL